MARPKNETQVSGTEPQPAPVQMPVAPRLHVERQGAQSEAITRRYPQIRGGICEFCGVLDQNQPAKYQYRLCPHYRGMEARCTYCPESKDPEDVVYHEILNVAEHPDKPGTLVMWCGSYNCSQAHTRRFKHAVS